MIFRLEGGVYRFAAGYSLDPAYLEHERRTPISPGPGTVVGRAAMSREVVQIEDAWTDPLYEQKAAVKISGGRSMIGVPLMREGEPIGVIGLARTGVDPFTQREIELVTTFADQAVIAIENVRLFEAEQQRTRELVETLEQQTATSQVLQVISTSAGDLQPVFESLLKNATQLCKAKFGTLYLREEGGVRLVASYDMPAEFYEVQARAATEPAPGGPLDGALKTKRAVQIPDLAATDLYRHRHPRAVDAVELGRIRTAVAVPMLKDDQPIGAIAIHRPEVALFDEKQIGLLTNFAAQAVIAIENARLLNELRQRTNDLAEALEKQTATSEVLRVVSSSPGDLQPVFEAMLANATRICAAKFGILWLCEAEGFRCVALHNTPPAFAEQYRREPVIQPMPGTGLRRLFETRQVAQVADMTVIQPYIERDRFVVTSVELGGYRSVVNVPMLKENELIGAISIYRQEVRPFTDKQIELVANFAAQAVIAIENARLLNELRESLQQQTATAEVLKAISRSTFDLQAVLDTLVEWPLGCARRKLLSCFGAMGRTLYGRQATAIHPSTLSNGRIGRCRLVGGRPLGALQLKAR